MTSTGKCLGVLVSIFAGFLALAGCTSSPGADAPAAATSTVASPSGVTGGPALTEARPLLVPLPSVLVTAADVASVFGRPVLVSTPCGPFADHLGELGCGYGETDAAVPVGIVVVVMDWPTDEVTWKAMYAAEIGKGSVSMPALGDDAFRFPEHSQPAPNAVSARKGGVGIEVSIAPGLADPDSSKTEALVKIALGHIPG